MKGLKTMPRKIYKPPPSAPRLRQKMISYAERGISEDILAELMEVKRKDLHKWIDPKKEKQAIEHIEKQDLTTLNNRLDYDVRYYAYWRDTASKRMAGDTGIDAEKGWNRTGKRNSDFHRLYQDALESKFDKSAFGPFARFLEEIGLREEGAWYDVGDTPE
jgi:CDP-glycerol glycerophosphotransferase (TagB/SpsB family)